MAKSIPKSDWITQREAAAKISVSTKTIQRMSIPWQDQKEKFKVRYCFVTFSRDNKARRIYSPDVDSLLVKPQSVNHHNQRTLVES